MSRGKQENYKITSKTGFYIGDLCYALKDEILDCTIIKQTSKTNLAKINQIVSSSKERVQPVCPYYTKCGGCQLQHSNYQNALNIKTNIVQTAISKIGKIHCVVKPCAPCEKQFGYRNKIALPINPKTKSVGMFRPESHKIIDIETCPLVDDDINKIINIINTYLKTTENTIYDEETKCGLLKQVVARKVENSILVTMVINGDRLSDTDYLWELLSKTFKNVGLSINVTKMRNNVILTDNFKQIRGIERAAVEEFEIKYTINNQSFMQVNEQIKHQIYSDIFSQIEGETVVDAYSGAGLLSAMMAKHAKKVYGIEIIKPATEAANELAKTNNIDNLININGDCSKELPALLNSLTDNERQNLTIVLDPPRKGCDKNVIDSILLTQPKKIIYLSCNPSTLARDINWIMSSNNYSASLIQPYDMFPQTKHVETLAILTKI